MDDRPTLEYRFIENRRERFRKPKVFLDNMDMPERAENLRVTLAPTAGRAGVAQKPE